MSEENINNNAELNLDDLDEASGGWTFHLGAHDVDVRCPKCGEDDQAYWYAKQTMCAPNHHILNCECKRCGIEFEVTAPGWGA